LKTEKRKMLAGELYRPDDSEIQADLVASAKWLARYNASLGEPPSVQHALLTERLAQVGKGTVIRPPFFCDYGFNISLGDGAVIGAASVVTRDVGPGQIVTGNPARPWTR
jgi:maltose O-acetyltransferase